MATRIKNVTKETLLVPLKGTKFDVAARRHREAVSALAAAQVRLEQAETRLGEERAFGAIKKARTMKTSELREQIANAARAHGADCADHGSAYTSANWHVFRALLGELAKRAGT